MNELYLLLAVFVGALCVLIALALTAVLKAFRELGEAAGEVKELARSLQPTAARLQRLGAAAEASEPDLKRMQRALRGLSEGSAQLGDAFARSAGWVGALLPLLEALFERWSSQQERATDVAPAGDAAPPPHTHHARPETPWQHHDTPRPPSTSHGAS